MKMIRSTPLVLSVFFLLLPTMEIQAQEAVTPSNLADTITVIGTARVQATPDRARFTVGVETVANTVDDAVKLNNQKVRDVLAALRRAGAGDAQLQTSHFMIHPRQEYREGQQPRVTGYQVSNTITVTEIDPQAAGRFLQAAIDAGANVASGIQFTVSNPDQLRREGLGAAFRKAREKAEFLAGQAGRTLGRVLAITEGGGPQPPQPMFRAMTAEVSTQEVPIEPGREEMELVLSVIFAMQ